MTKRDSFLLESYLDGELSDETRLRLEKRLGEKLELRRELDELRAIRESLAAMPKGAIVPDRVWAVVRDAVQAMPRDEPSDVIPLSSARTGSASRRLSFTVPQLAAAAVALVALGGALTWSTRSATGPLGPEDGIQGVTPVSASLDRAPLEELWDHYEASSADFMEIIENGASVLSEETLGVVLESVAAIDQAVSEAREALAADPGSELLNRILISNMQKKLDLLRNTAAAIQQMA